MSQSFAEICRLAKRSLRYVFRRPPLFLFVIFNILVIGIALVPFLVDEQVLNVLRKLPQLNREQMKELFENLPEPTVPDWYTTYVFPIIPGILELFSGVALYHYVMFDLGERRPNLKLVLRKTVEHAKQVFCWYALVFVTVLATTFLTAMLEGFNSILGSAASWSITGLGYLLSFFAIPLIAAEGLYPLQLLRRIAVLLRATSKDVIVGSLRLLLSGILFLVLATVGLIAMFIATSFLDLHLSAFETMLVGGTYTFLVVFIVMIYSLAAEIFAIILYTETVSGKSHPNIQRAEWLLDDEQPWRYRRLSEADGLL